MSTETTFPSVEEIHKIFTAFEDMTNYVAKVEGVDEPLLRAVQDRMNESAALMLLACGCPYPFRKELRSVTQELNDVVLAIEKRIGAPLPDDEHLVEAMAIRDDALMRLDAARIAGLCSLVHLSRALDGSTPQQPTLKAASNG